MSGDQMCVNCKSSYNNNSLYCATCGHILPHAFTNSGDTTLTVRPSDVQGIDMEWGASYFHQRATLSLLLLDNTTQIPVPLDAAMAIIGRNSTSASVDVDLAPY